MKPVTFPRLAKTITGRINCNNSAGCPGKNRSTAVLLDCEQVVGAILCKPFRSRCLTLNFIAEMDSRLIFMCRCVYLLSCGPSIDRQLLPDADWAAKCRVIDKLPTGGGPCRNRAGNLESIRMWANVQVGLQNSCNVCD